MMIRTVRQTVTEPTVLGRGRIPYSEMPVLIVSLEESRIICEMGLWECQGQIMITALIEKGRVPIVGGTIPCLRF